ncbi:MAG TPA: flagellum-specific ATP synthase FliI, partial [Acidobacteriaceae bacterium]
NHYPPISVLDSLSRLMPSVTTGAHMAKARALRLLLAAHGRSEDLIRIGAYQKGSDPVLDQAVQSLPALQAFLQQDAAEVAPFEQTVERLCALPCQQA